MARKELKFPYPVLNGQGTLTPTIKDRFATDDAPKLKFNHFAQFKFRSPLSGSVPRESRGGLTLQSNFLPLKQTGRINPIINYADVNYYGFRTKVATKTDFSTFNMTLYDDSANRTISIVKAYMEAVSPIVNASNANDIETRQTIGALENASRLGVIEEITVKHTSWKLETIYHFYNPKITNIMTDELDMTVTDVANISMTFVFDSYNIEADVSAG